jgi:hypothetical protein
VPRNEELDLLEREMAEEDDAEDEPVLEHQGTCRFFFRNTYSMVNTR